MKRIIINADDLALAECVNNGIIESIKNGLVSSTTIMACGSAFNHAVGLLKEHQIDSVGVHLVLDEETPLLSESEIPSIVNDKGRFHDRGPLLKKLLFSNSINMGEVKKEFRAQIQHCLDAGLDITHLDGHGHVHVYPKISTVVAELAREFNIQHVRMPAESFFYLDFPHLPLKKIINKVIVTSFALLAKGVFRKAGMTFPQRFIGMLFGGNLNQDNLGKILQKLPAGREVEIMCHPGYQNSDLDRTYEAWQYNWQKELTAMVSQKKDTLKKQYNIEVISYRNL